MRNFFNEICVLLRRQMDGSQFSEFMRSIKSDYDKIDKLKQCPISFPPHMKIFVI